MKYGRICKRLEPKGDINRFTKKKRLMNAILGEFDFGKSQGSIKKVIDRTVWYRSDKFIGFEL